jgi:hypothetical protein
MMTDRALASFCREGDLVVIRNENGHRERQPAVLIVDDEPHIVDFLEIGFSYEGFRVLGATSGSELLWYSSLM